MNEFDFGILLVVMMCGFGGIAIWYVAKTIFLILYLLAMAVSYTRWCLRVISTEGQIAWDAKPWYERWKITIKHVFTDSILSVSDHGRVTKGNYHWEGIFDHNP